MSYATIQTFDKLIRFGTLTPLDSNTPLVFCSKARDFETDEVVVFDESTWAVNVRPAPAKDGSQISILDGVPNIAANRVGKFNPDYYGV
jgi:hypothetical protein